MPVVRVVLLMNYCLGEVFMCALATTVPDNGSYVPGKREIEGRWMTFVESGPLIVFDTQVWPCIWNLLQTDLVSGYGKFKCSATATTAFIRILFF